MESDGVSPDEIDLVILTHSHPLWINRLRSR
jgi:hypothetical protein